MKHIKTYQIFESQRELKQDQINFLNKHIDGTWTLNDEGLVDINGDFYCSGENIKDFKGICFGKVSGDFICSSNLLTSLVGGPRVVGEDFYCNNNKLTSLVGCPQEVGGNFRCQYNQLTSLNGGPKKVGGDFDCSYNGLTSLEGGPQEVGEYFDCSYNQLTSLVGSPQEVGEYFDCNRNNLKSLEGYPKQVDNFFRCDSFTIDKGEWNIKNLWDLFLNGEIYKKRLLSSIFSEEVLQKKIDEDPNGMIIELSPIWKEVKKMYPNLVFPKGKEELDTLSDLSDLGF